MNITSIIPSDITSIAINGMSKNAGKTTVLNQLIHEYTAAGRTIGISSVGVDGEKYDVWSGLSKPAIHVHAGMLVATSRLALDEAEARFEILEKIKDSSIGNDVYLVRTTKGGAVKLTGTPSLHEIKQVLQGFRYYGAEMSLIDGAYDRISSSNPEVADGSILVVGAAYHRSLALIVEHLQEWIFRYTLPQYVPNEAELRLLQQQSNAIWLCKKTEEHRVLSVPFVSEWNKSVRGEEPYLFLPGSCTGSTLREAGACEHTPTIILRDGTRLFAKWEEIAAFYRRGGELQVLHPHRLLGIAINPFSPDGFHFDSEQMLAQVRKVSRDVPVFDVVRGTLVT